MLTARNHGGKQMDQKSLTLMGIFPSAVSGVLAEVHLLLGISRLISIANEMAPGCHCCATVEQQKSLILWDVKKMELRPGDKAWRQGPDNWKCWLGPLGCLQHRLQMTASYHLTDALSWLQSISYCTSLYITARAVVKPAWSNQPWLLLSLQSLLFPSPNPSLLQGKKTKPNHPKTQPNPVRYPPQTEFVST